MLENDEPPREMKVDVSTEVVEVALADAAGGTIPPIISTWFTKKARARMNNFRARMKTRRVLAAAGATSGDDFFVMQNSRIHGDIKLGRSKNVKKRRRGLQ